MNIKAKRFVSSLILTITVALLLISLPIPAHAQGNKPRTIRVGYPIQGGLTGFDEQGNYIGYTYAYLQEIAQYTGWIYEFVEVQGDLNTQLRTLMDMLKAGTIDLMGGMLYSEAIVAEYDCGGRSYGTVETVLQVPKEDTTDVMIDPQAVQTMSIAILRTAKKRFAELEEFCKQNLITPEYILCDTVAEQLQAIRDGRAHAMSNISLNILDGVRTIAKFAPRPFYFLAAKNDPQDILESIDLALFNIDQIDPQYSVNLHEKYFYADNDDLVFSDAERAYVQSIGELKVGYLNNQPPFQYLNHETGQPSGISVDMLSYIAKQTGLAFQFVPADNMEQLFAMAQNGRIDMVAGIPNHFNQLLLLGISVTRSYISAPYMLMMNEQAKGTLDGKLLALSKTSANRGYFAGEVVRYDTVDDCIRAVIHQEADYTYTDSYTAQYYMNHPDVGNLQFSSSAYDPWEISIGIATPNKQELLTILNKAIISLSIADIQPILYQNTLRKQDYSLIYFIRQNPIETILTVSGFLVCVIALLLIFLFQRTKTSKKFALELNKHLRVYRLVDDYFFEYDYRKNSLLVSAPAGTADGEPELIHYDCSAPPQPGISAERKREFIDLIKSRKNICKEIRLFCTDGQWHWLHIVLERIYDDVGNPAYVIGKIHIIDDEKKEKEMLIKQAQFDSLTHILNAEMCKKQTEKELAAMRKGDTGALILFDIDNFKGINDTYGHRCGDLTLRQVAQLLKKNFRADDIIGRPGGDEFFAYIKSIHDRQELIAICDRLGREAHGIQMEDGTKLTISIGALLTKPCQKYEDVFVLADRALYRAKHNGRDRFEIVQEGSECQET